MALETPRLLLREFEPEDEGPLQAILEDPRVVAFKGPKGKDAARRIMERSRESYRDHGYGFWAAVLRERPVLIGLCGLLNQVVDGHAEVEISYTLGSGYWDRGLATEAARAIKSFGFDTLGLDRLISIIEPSNIGSQKVAMKAGLSLEKQTSWRELTVLVYAVRKQPVR